MGHTINTVILVFIFWSIAATVDLTRMIAVVPVTGFFYLITVGETKQPAKSLYRTCVLLLLFSISVLLLRITEQSTCDQIN